METGVLCDRASLSDYLVELLRTWGLRSVRNVQRDDAAALEPETTPVCVVPACDTSDIDDALIDYASRGGTVIAAMPTGPLAAACGWKPLGALEGPMRLRPWGIPSPGLAGEQLPIVGSIARYELTQQDATCLAYLSYPTVCYDEHPGIAQRPVGQGAVVGLAFDLARGLMLMRQGDPAKAEIIPAGDGCARTMHLAVDIGGVDAGLFPHADLLGRLLVELIARAMPAPTPRVDHLPRGASAIVLFSGDEDVAPLDSIQCEFADVYSRSGHMNLYIIPDETHSTREHVTAYRTQHDVGPHPNLRKLDGQPIRERVAEYDRQLAHFADIFGVRPRSVRNHCHAWAGYLDLVHVQARHGIRMDANFPTVGYMRSREDGPYTAFGAAMPMRFVEKNGELIDVFQQHTHVSDDAQFFIPEDVREQHYSFRTTFDVWRINFTRYLNDAASRFHTPIGCNFHPSNWVKFSGDFGRFVLDSARERGVPVWSYDQWCAFWSARDSWEVEHMRWVGTTLSWHAHGQCTDGLMLELPLQFNGLALSHVMFGSTRIDHLVATRHGKAVAQVECKEGEYAAAYR